MGFCRSCGDIVSGARCKCGGASVAPVVPWTQSSATETVTDRWSNTYVHREKSVSPMRSINTHTTGSTVTPTPSPTKRFPRPISNYVAPKSELDKRVTAHIASTTSSSSRPPSPLKHSSILPAPESDILPSLSPYVTTLSKVYGSVLQPKESLSTHSCAICSAPFLPDATIYPELGSIEPSRFLCKKCFTVNGGSRGECPTCSRPVLMLASEGGFVHAADRYWHKRCFNCAGCFKNIGDSPMLDLMGLPSCVQCFDRCLDRDPSTPARVPTRNHKSPIHEKTINIGGMKTESLIHRDRETGKVSPAIEELEQRLGITKSREGSPALEELSQRLSMIGRDLTSRKSVSGNSPVTNTTPTKYFTQSKDGRPPIDRSWERHEPRITNTPSPSRKYGHSKPIDNISSEPQTLPVRDATNLPSPGQFQTASGSAPSLEAIEEMKQRFMKGSYSPSTAKVHTPADSPNFRTSMHRVRSSTSLREISTSRILVPPFHDDLPSPQSPAVPQTPDLMSDHSDTMTQSSFSGPESPPGNIAGAGDIFSMPSSLNTRHSSRFLRGELLDDFPRQITEEVPSELRTPTRTLKSMKYSKNDPTQNPRPLPIPTPLSHPTKLHLLKSSPLQPQSPHASSYSENSDLPTSTCCAGCGGHLFSIGEGGEFVTVPSTSGSTETMLYHIDCFRCAICRGIFNDANTGHAVFARTNDGPCHVECTPPTKITIRKVPSLGRIPYRSTDIPPSTCDPNSTSTSIPMYTPSSRIDRPPSMPPTASFPRFGSRTACPGCHKSVSPMERGVVPGPQGTRWHASCLICGGKKDIRKGWRGRDKKTGEPGCGKQLDSAAKSGGNGGVWCRECLLLLGVGGSPQASSTRTPLLSNHTGPGKVTPQLTGTTIARQFTGLGGNKDAALIRQLTGGGLSPTRSISPTKQLGASGRPRPKSVIGMRHSKSIDEGRGMFLVRQLTGASSGEWVG
ncbi:hypothetical protein BDZ94DRAFT_1276114 [Collybia nuda]|uniref:LIM zinc-binding domain-containing protein n=1 Tax=Collybia nuda TaxID=64659 RepID=A0A9P6CBP5_9AGAR|nr:hypothetical protein BDZ94DRAFT_1276114 [Collybia nuda]